MEKGLSRSNKDYSNISLSSTANNNTEGVEMSKVEENHNSVADRLLEKRPVSYNFLLDKTKTFDKLFISR